MNFPLWLTAVILLLLTSAVLCANAYPHFKGLKEGFWHWSMSGFNYPHWRWPWQGHFSVPWHSGQYAHWQHPYQPWQPWRTPPLPATGGVSSAGPGACEDYCGWKVCSEYRDRSRKLQNCLSCRSRGLCVADTASGSCGKCDQSDTSLGSCYDQYGCRDVDFERGNRGLLNPKYTKCQLCPS